MNIFYKISLIRRGDIQTSRLNTTKEVSKITKAVKFSLLIVVFFSIFTTACNQEKQSTVSSSNSWAFDFITWNNTIYKETNKLVDKVGPQIGSVTSFATQEDHLYHGTYSNKFEVGTKIYSIEGIKTTQAIAVKCKEKYIMLIESTLNEEDIH